MVRNKDKLKTQDYIQQEGIDYTKTFAFIAILEAIRLLLLLSYIVNHDIPFFKWMSKVMKGKLKLFSEIKINQCSDGFIYINLSMQWNS